MIPECLYHYTSLSAFALILKSRGIRFNRLDQVDDLTEGKAMDLGNLGMYQFVSCWTSDVQERIPFWNMYTARITGVRIRLPTCMFKTFDQESLPKYKGIFIDPGTKHILKLNDRIGDNFIVGPLPQEFPHEMRYTDDPSLLRPKVMNEPNTVEFGKLGICKLQAWRFESEWRFRVFVAPHPVPSDGDFSDPQFSQTVSQRTREIFNLRKVSKTSLFAQINDEAFRDMEVTLGPRHTESDMVILESLVERLNPDCQIITSCFTGQIRRDH